MCGRYSEEEALNEVRLEFDAEPELFREYQPTFNIAPSYSPGFEQLIVVRKESGQRALRLARWWMIPEFWKKSLRELPTSFNARAEELATKPFFRGAFATRRCLVPATGWREFKAEQGQKKKQPYHFRPQKRLFAFGGLFSRFTTADGDVVDTFAIVTTAPNAVASAIHDRMPLVIPPELYASWLDPDVDAASVLALACAENQTLSLEVFASDPVGNDVRFEGPSVVQKAPAVPIEVPAQGDLFARPNKA
jgi:putative SOS response-associated peptidase YedK